MAGSVWPPDGMSNFGYPGFSYRIERIGPTTLVTRFPDGTESRRMKSGHVTRRFFERWRVNRADLKAMLRVYDRFGKHRQLVRRGLDAISGDTNFSEDRVIARFEEEPTWDQIGPDWYQAFFTFIEVEK